MPWDGHTLAVKSITLDLAGDVEGAFGIAGGSAPTLACSPSKTGACRVTYASGCVLNDERDPTKLA